MWFRRQLKNFNLWQRRLRLPRGLVLGKGAFLRPPFKIPYAQGISLGAGTHIHTNALIILFKEHAGVTFSPRVVIGEDVYMGRNLYMACVGEITIGDRCGFSDEVFINDSDHSLDWSLGHIEDRPLITKGPIRIGSDCYIGYRVAILGGVTLGDHCVVGVNSVVTRSFPPYSMIGGSPARLLRTYDHATRTWVVPTEPTKGSPGSE